jgi:protein gp37
VSDKSKIEWTDATWNPIRGCSRVSEGCRNCYAEHTAARFSGKGKPYEGLATIKNVQRPDGSTATTEYHWTGEVRLVESALDAPLRWKKPRMIFVNSMSDLFHEKVSDLRIDLLFKIMRECPQHTFQILTKRAFRMKEYFERPLEWAISHAFPLPNVWLGVSVEDQKTADERIPLLLNTPAAVRWVSYEPALGPVDFGQWIEYANPAMHLTWLDGLDWIVCGGESGAHARPMHPDWARLVRDQCQATAVPFFFKQWGEWIAAGRWPAHENGRGDYAGDGTGRLYRGIDAHGMRFIRVGKACAGRLLDGREWNQFPNPCTVLRAST